MEHIKFKVNTTGHIYTLGESIDEAEHVWFVFHGYGQLASTIIRKFEGIDTKQHFVISVEGLSRFYWNGVYGKVAASWMTKQDRLEEIDDYLHFIDQVYDHFALSTMGKRFHCLAFSQGTATCWRWLAHRRPELSSFIQWAGTCPPELDYKEELKDYIQSFKHHFLVGDKDEFITPEVWSKVDSFFKDNLLSPKIRQYKGEHKIYREILQEVIAEISIK